MPANWRELPLEECLSAIIDYRGKTPRKTTTGIPLITAKIIKAGRINTPQEFIASTDYDNWMRRGLPREGDIVLTTEAPLGEVAQLDGQKVALAQRVVTLRGKDGVLENNFLKYALQSHRVQEDLRRRATGTTVLGIKQRELRKITLAIPPIEEQRRIAHILGTLDDKIDLNRRMNQTLESIARALFKSWFVDFDPVRAKAEGRDTGLPKHIADLFPARLAKCDIGKAPSGWAVCPISELVNIFGGSTPSTKNEDYWNGGTNHWVTPKYFSSLNSPALLTSDRRITDAGLATISSGLNPIGTILFSSRAPIGYIAIAEIPVAINQGFIAMRPKEGVSNLFVWQWLSDSIAEIKRRANGSTFPEISKKNFRPIPTICPSSAVMNAFHRLVEPIYQRIVANQRESDSLQEARRLLLANLLRRIKHIGDGSIALDEPLL